MRVTTVRRGVIMVKNISYEAKIKSASLSSFIEDEE